jgi:D-tyrosyl-tRNA(Tyr) deacylase
MIGLLQRASSAQVVVGGEKIAAIGRGLLVLVGVEAGDSAAQADRLLDRLLGSARRCRSH